MRPRLSLLATLILSSLASMIAAPRVAHAVGSSVAIRPSSVVAMPNHSADAADSEIASRWADLLYEDIQTTRLFPPQAARVVGYFGVTLHEAVAPGRPRGQSLAGRLNGWTGAPQPSGDALDWPSVANAAAARVITQLFALTRPIEDICADAASSSTDFD